uniref:Uncharacterized protein n=1 Tax=Oryza brachyantha TaxID=4533 RepID=J3M420_ORYBR
MAAESGSDAAPISNRPVEEEVTVERTPESEEEERLRYLEFVQQAAAQALVLAPSSAPSTTASMASPSTSSSSSTARKRIKLHMKLVVGESVQELDRRVPPVVKEAPGLARSAAAELSARYNTAVLDGAKRGNAVATYLPLVPTERLSRVFAYPLADSASPPAPEMQPIPSQ